MHYIESITRQARQRGTTLIELSVVIAVLLLLVGVLFIGITAWKNGANTAACVVNLSSIQKAVRGYENMNGLNPGAILAVGTLGTPGAGFWANTPVCPGWFAYAFTGSVPAPGVASATCAGPHHAP